MDKAILTYGNVRLLNVPHAESVAREVFEQDCYQLDRIPRGAIVIDVGAFYGEFGLACVVERDCCVVAYEPCDVSRAVCRANLGLNDIPCEGGSFAVFPYAVAALAGPRAFAVNAAHPASSCFAPGPSVQCTTMSGAIATARHYFGDGEVVVKLDCEGAEREIVVAGAAWLDAVSTITMEWHNHDGAAFRDILAQAGFDVTLMAGGPPPRPPWDPSIGGGLLFASR